MPRPQVLRQMRDQERISQRSGAKTVPSPIGGLNQRDSLAAMEPTDAIILDNWFVRPSWIEPRGGLQTLGTYVGNGESLMAYNALSGINQLFVAVNNAGSCAIYRCDNLGGGGVGAPVVGSLTNARWDWQQFGTGAGEFLVLVNGADDPYLYDGGSWHDLRTDVTYQLTGGPSPLSNLAGVVRYKNRLWFWQGNTFNVYYLPQNVVAGALTLLNIGPNFTLGGYLQAVVTNSIDNSQGINDYIAFISNQGEVVMYQGYDPASAATFFEAGHFMIGTPLAFGRRTWTKIGSDAVVLCKDGAIPLSKALVTDRSQQTIAVSDKIRDGFRQAAQSYATNFGWQVILYPENTKIVCNVPTVTDAQSFQYVQNTINGGWSTFGNLASPWNAMCFERMGGNLYFSGVTAVYQCDTGFTDANGASISLAAKTAFNYFGEPEKLKTFQMAQPFFQVSGALTASFTVNVDFDNTAPTSSVQLSQGNQSPWNTSFWGPPGNKPQTFWSDVQQIAKPYVGIAGAGLCAAMQMRLNVANIAVLKWMATKYFYTAGGIFYAGGSAAA